VVKITSPEDLKIWFARQGRNVAIIIANRAVLRSLPLTADWVYEQPSRHSAALILPILRAIAAPWLVSAWPNCREEIQGFSAFVSYAYNPYVDPSKASFKANSVSTSAAACGASAKSSDNLNGLPGFFGYAAIASATAAFDRESEFPAYDSETLTFAADIWGETLNDVAAIEFGDLPEVLACRPLWSTTVPDWVGTHWASLKPCLQALDQDWQVWTDWYDDRLLGADHPNSRSLIEELELKRVLIADEDWKKGPAHVNAIIAKLEAEYRLETPPKQVPGPLRFVALDDGHVGLAPRSGPTEGVSGKLLESLLETLQVLAKEIVAGIEGSNAERSTQEAAQRYADQVRENLEELNMILASSRFLELAERIAHEHKEGSVQDGMVKKFEELKSHHDEFRMMFDEVLEYEEFKLKRRLPEGGVPPEILDHARQGLSLPETSDILTTDARNGLGLVTGPSQNNDPEIRKDQAFDFVTSYYNLKNMLDKVIIGLEGALNKSEHLMKQGAKVVLAAQALRTVLDPVIKWIAKIWGNF